MGQGSSQPADLAENEESQNDQDMHIAQPYPAPPTAIKGRKSESQQEGGTPIKRKRKSSHSVASPLAVASPEHQPSSAKRKRVIDILAESDNATADRKSELQVADSQKTPGNRTADGRVLGSQSRASSVRSLKRPQSTIVKGDYKMSPSPALSTGDRQAKGRLNRADGTSSAGGATGTFQPHEVEALEDFKIHFCNSNSCPTTIFDLMVQHGNEGPFPGANGVKKKEFWRLARDILPHRERRSLIRFMKRHFQASSQKPHEWTDEQEDELVALHKQHGPKWVQIAEMLGRSSDDVVQRWKNRLEHRSTMNTGVWSDTELGLLKKALRSAWSKMKAEGYDVGENIYEMDESLISWGKVSDNMQHYRSRQQCADKWRRIKLHMTEPGSRANSRLNSRSISRSATPSSAKREHARGRKSKIYVNSEDDESDAAEQGAEREKKSTPERSTKKMSWSLANGKLRAPNKQTKVNSSEDESGSISSSESSDSDSESESKSKPGLSDGKSKAGRSSTKSNGPDKKTSAQKSKRPATPSSSDESKSDSNSDSDSDSDSKSKEVNRPNPSAHKLKAPKKTKPSKEETSSDESSDSSSEEESKNEHEIPVTPSPEPTTQDTLKASKRKRKESPAKEAETQDDKRVKVEKGPSPTPFTAASSESTSESDEESKSRSKKKANEALASKQANKAPGNSNANYTNDSDSSSEETSSSGSSSDSDSDSDSE